MGKKGIDELDFPILCDRSIKTGCIRRPMKKRLLDISTFGLRGRSNGLKMGLQFFKSICVQSQSVSPEVLQSAVTWQLSLLDCLENADQKQVFNRILSGVSHS